MAARKQANVLCPHMSSVSPRGAQGAAIPRALTAIHAGVPVPSGSPGRVVWPNILPWRTRTRPGCKAWRSELARRAVSSWVSVSAAGQASAGLRPGPAPRWGQALCFRSGRCVMSTRREWHCVLSPLDLLRGVRKPWRCEDAHWGMPTVLASLGPTGGGAQEKCYREALAWQDPEAPVAMSQRLGAGGGGDGGCG